MSDWMHQRYDPPRISAAGWLRVLGRGLLLGAVAYGGLALLLARMPWNRRRAGAGAGDKGGGCCTVGER